MSTVKTFAQALCEQAGCGAEDYLRVALKRCLYPRARFLYLVPPFYARVEDIELLEAAGAATSEEQVVELLREYWDEVNLRGGILAKRCKLRVSGARLQKLFREVMRGEAGALGG
jgi:hypothetical protein